MSPFISPRKERFKLELWPVFQVNYFLYNIIFILQVTIPGSGNTWVRHLLEGATGFFTSSIYRDKDLKAGGFLGETVRFTDGSTVATKTHLSSFQDHTEKERREKIIEDFGGRGIVIIRNPFDVRVM